MLNIRTAFVPRSPYDWKQFNRVATLTKLLAQAMSADSAAELIARL